MTSITAWLDELEQAHKAATPGPWSGGRSGRDLVGPDGTSLIDGLGALHSTDAAAIVAAHNGLPALVAAMRAVTEVLDAAENRFPDFSPAGDPLPAIVSVADLRTALATAMPEDAR